MTAPQIQFSSVVRVARSVWRDPEPVAPSAVPGTIFLLGEWGETGGLLRMTRQGFLLLLTRGQVFLGETFWWPISGFPMRIRGDVLERVGA